MKKIGILLNSTDCDMYLHNTVCQLSKSKNVELYLLVNSNAAPHHRGLWRKLSYKIKTQGLHRSIQIAFFRLMAKAEQKIFSSLYEDVKEYSKTASIAAYVKDNFVELNPSYSRSGIVVRYPNAEIERIQQLKLDLIIRGNATGIFKGGILTTATMGIISFHHGDNRWNRGGPPGFWEVYQRRPSSGFIIQKLNEELDGGTVIFRGGFPTLRSYTENMINLFRESNPYLAKLVLEYAANNSLPTSEKSVPFGGPLLKVPTLGQSIVYMLRTVYLLASFGVNRIVLRKRSRWSVAFIANGWREAILRKGTRVKNPPNRCFADPFIVKRNEKTVCYVEDFNYQSKLGCISAIEIVDKKKYKVLGPVIEEPFHMSFPFIFEYQNELYMVPETYNANSVRLYRCAEFPLKWEYQKDILKNVSAADTMIFEFEGIWWLLTNIATEGNRCHSSQLFAYHSTDPLSDEWTPHEKKPLIFNSNIGRNGGLLLAENGLPVRVRQKQGFDTYGAALTLAQITDLNPSSYKEQKIGEILPDYFPDSKRCHHLHSNGEYTVYDFAQNETLK